MDATSRGVTPQWERSVVSWLVWRRRQGDDLPAALAYAAEHRPEFPADLLKKWWPASGAAVANVELFRGARDNCRLCDIPGIQLRPSPK